MAHFCKHANYVGIKTLQSTKYNLVILLCNFLVEALNAVLVFDSLRNIPDSEDFPSWTNRCMSRLDISEVEKLHVYGYVYL